MDLRNGGVVETAAGRMRSIALGNGRLVRWMSTVGVGQRRKDSVSETFPPHAIKTFHEQPAPRSNRLGAPTQITVSELDISGEQFA